MNLYEKCIPKILIFTERQLKQKQNGREHCLFVIHPSVCYQRCKTVKPGFRNDIRTRIGIMTVKRPITQAQAQAEEFFFLLVLEPCYAYVKGEPDAVSISINVLLYREGMELNIRQLSIFRMLTCLCLCCWHPHFRYS